MGQVVLVVIDALTADFILKWAEREGREDMMAGGEVGEGPRGRP